LVAQAFQPVHRRARFTRHFVVHKTQHQVFVGLDLV